MSERVISGISDAVVSGELAPGDRLPPERELAGQFGVSRTVVRDAVKTLSGRGILRAKRGAGNFVADPEEVAPAGLGGLALGAGASAISSKSARCSKHRPRSGPRDVVASTTSDGCAG